MHRLNNSALWIVCLLVLLPIASCVHDQDDGEYVARVGERYLTNDDLSSGVDSLNNVIQQRMDYIDNWVVTEILYQEALRQGFGESGTVERQVELARKQLVITNFLDRELYDEGSVTVSEEDILNVHKNANQEFLLKEDIAHVSLARFGERDAANSFRTRIIRGASWDEAVSAAREDSLQASSLLHVASREYFSRSTLYPEELWKLCRTLGKDEVSFAVRTGNGYYILLVHGLKRQGELPELEYVRDEVRQRIIVERRQKKYERLLSDLRSQYAIEIKPDVATSDEKSAQ